MNYRHHFHAGNFADVMKHALLVQLVRALQRKPKGCLLVDTHAGRGAYDLTRAAVGDTLARRPEHPEGIGRLWDRTDLPAGLAEYVTQVRRFAAGGPDAANPGRPESYPGSPLLLRLLARPQDRLALCEMHPEEAAALREVFAGERRVSVQEMNGYDAVSALLPPPEKRAFVLVDPPFELQDEWQRIVAALTEGLRRLPAGTFAIWYPITQRARADYFMDNIAPLKLPPTLLAEIIVDPSAAKLTGCGMVIVNPPWQFEDEAGPTLSYLAEALAQNPGGKASLRWLVPE